MGAASEIAVVTGGSGCLGQHVVRMLQLKADHVKEIRVLDILPYRNILGHTEQKPVISIVGSVCDPEVVRKACQGATSVFHLAAVVSYGTYPNSEAMEEVNVKGTQNIIDACVDGNVKRLIFSSSMDIVCGYGDLVKANEDTKQPSRFLFRDYATSKMNAELFVNGANGKKVQNGGTLQTISLRPCGIYGEGDQHFVAFTLGKAASMCNGYIIKVGNGKKIMSQAYAGNVAWGFLCADSAIQERQEVAGNVYFLKDDTPCQNIFCFMRPYLEDQGMRISSFHLPFWLVFYAMYLINLIVQLISPLCKIQNEINHEFILRICNDYTVCDDKARDILGYSPLFTPEEASLRSAKYYSQLPVWKHKENVGGYSCQLYSVEGMEDINRNIHKGLE